MAFKNADLVRTLYIHWPFCPYKCSFCPFVAFSKFDRFMVDYQKALLKEMEDFSRESGSKNNFRTIYIGGGTPSTWPDELLLDMFGRLNDMFCLDAVEEITIEANPGTVRQEQLVLWKELGITRISVGVQSLNDIVLEKLTRYQKAADVRKFISWADGMFTSLSIDLILGLPEISDDEWKKQLDEIVTWPIQHISVYFLSIHEGTALYFKVKRDTVLLPADDDIVDLYHWTIDFLKVHGFIQYEISSFAKPGYESKHNRAYWSRDLYRGLGVGAWSYDGECRFQNEKKLMAYIEAQKNNDTCLAYKEILTAENVRFEKIMLGLRSLQGFLIEDALVGLPDVGDRIYLTTKALAIENEVAVALTV